MDPSFAYELELGRLQAEEYQFKTARNISLHTLRKQLAARESQHYADFEIFPVLEWHCASLTGKFNQSGLFKLTNADVDGTTFYTER